MSATAYAVGVTASQIEMAAESAKDNDELCAAYEAALAAIAEDAFGVEPRAFARAVLQDHRTDVCSSSYAWQDAHDIEQLKDDVEEARNDLKKAMADVTDLDGRLEAAGHGGHRS